MNGLIIEILKMALPAAAGGAFIGPILAARKDGRDGRRDHVDLVGEWEARYASLVERLDASMGRAAAAEDRAAAAERAVSDLTRRVDEMTRVEELLAQHIVSLRTGVEVGTVPPLPPLPPEIAARLRF
ncbi:hypothetical protein [Janibacter massiliensis]|uniref:hypothetical protein n=1 Tax=Janibacter massiliensis TaxID=2058291 RepID=UPI000D0EACD8|nr:hypothetical protein [Janibacter massiliensis]